MTATIEIPTLETERLVLRPPTAEALEAYIAFYQSDRSAFVGGPSPRDQAWRAYASEIGHWTLRGYGRWAVQERASGLWCGQVGLWFPDGWPEPEVGWSLFGAAEGRGIAFEAASAARAHAYDALGWNSVISLIDPANARSIALAERMGAARESEFEHVRYGRMGVWRHPSSAALREAS